MQRLGQTDLAPIENHPLRERGRQRGGWFLHINPHFQTQRDRDNHSPSGSAQDRQDLSPKNILSFPERRMGRREEGSGGETRDKHRCGRTKSRLILREGVRRRRIGDVGPEWLSKRPMLRGWRAFLCCSAEIEQTCLLSADADKKRDMRTVSSGSWHTPRLSAWEASFLPLVAIAKPQYQTSRITARLCSLITQLATTGLTNK